MVHADDGARATDVRRNVSVLMPVVCVVLGSNGGLRREGFTTFRGGARAEPERGAPRPTDDPSASQPRHY